MWADVIDVGGLAADGDGGTAERGGRLWAVEVCTAPGLLERSGKVGAIDLNPGGGGDGFRSAIGIGGRDAAGVGNYRGGIELAAQRSGDGGAGSDSNGPYSAECDTGAGFGGLSEEDAKSWIVEVDGTAAFRREVGLEATG